ncbi:hypothetical protein [Mesorhizobium sp. B2-8-5]|uniref:hypothetical protein n=1 Tax=Mesorhizobium sp. B2-8-5 TaxID=2589903 RepID=UPI00112E8CAB|nr:hypothetical protein [Mesorhizobium sp. B2-8-5]UCI24591.1 hypothetical protein FJ430_23800 [Mesorhizobium sp. B2-8-5]
MRPLVLVAAAVFALLSGAARSDDLDQPEALSKSCPRGVLFKEIRSGIVVTVVRQGQGKAVFTEDKHRLQGATAAEILTKEGEHGFIYGPMRSYMFAVDPDVVKDFEWRPAETEYQAFYTLRDDDGNEALLNFVDIGCAP